MVVEVLVVVVVVVGLRCKGLRQKILDYPHSAQRNIIMDMGSMGAEGAATPPTTRHYEAREGERGGENENMDRSVDVIEKLKCEV